MNQRISKKIEKRAGCKKWDDYWQYLIDRRVAAVTKDMPDAEPGTTNMVYLVTSRKRRKRKILRLLCFYNCYPTNMSSSTSENPRKFDVEFMAQPIYHPGIDEVANKLHDQFMNIVINGQGNTIADYIHWMSGIRDPQLAELDTATAVSKRTAECYNKLVALGYTPSEAEHMTKCGIVESDVQSAYDRPFEVIDRSSIYGSTFEPILPNDPNSKGC